MVRGLLLIALLALLAAPPATAATPLEKELLREINRAREARGRAPLRIDPALGKAARAHSTDMLRRDYFSHRDFSRRMQRSGARGPRLGENLAWASGGTATAKTFVRMWLRSPGHRANMLRPSFERIGISARGGTLKGVDGAVVVTTVFAGR